MNTTKKLPPRVYKNEEGHGRICFHYSHPLKALPGEERTRKSIVATHPFPRELIESLSPDQQTQLVDAISAVAEGIASLAYWQGVGNADPTNPLENPI